MKKPKLLIFDVNETLLDLDKVKQEITRHLGDPTAFSLWFSTLLQYSAVETLTHQYHPFGEIGKATLKMTAEKLNKKITEQELSKILSLLTQLPSHSEVNTALDKLRSYNYRMVALTNGSKDAVKAQMNYSGLTAYFERLFSTEEVQCYKPHSKTYQFVLRETSILPEDALMVAAHPWDLAGAKSVRMQTAFIKRPSQIYYPLIDRADYMIQDLNELVEALQQ